jgi:hypothetical protein
MQNPKGRECEESPTGKGSALTALKYDRRASKTPEVHRVYIFVTNISHSGKTLDLKQMRRE